MSRSIHIVVTVIIAALAVMALFFVASAGYSQENLVLNGEFSTNLNSWSCVRSNFSAGTIGTHCIATDGAARSVSDSRIRQSVYFEAGTYDVEASVRAVAQGNGNSLCNIRSQVVVYGVVGGSNLTINSSTQNYSYHTITGVFTLTTPMTAVVEYRGNNTAICGNQSQADYIRITGEAEPPPPPPVYTDTIPITATCFITPTGGGGTGTSVSANLLKGLNNSLEDFSNESLKIPNFWMWDNFLYAPHKVVRDPDYPAYPPTNAYDEFHYLNLGVEPENGIYLFVSMPESLYQFGAAISNSKSLEGSDWWWEFSLNQPITETGQSGSYSEEFDDFEAWGAHNFDGGIVTGDSCDGGDTSCLSHQKSSTGDSYIYTELELAGDVDLSGRFYRYYGYEAALIPGSSTNYSEAICGWDLTGEDGVWVELSDAPGTCDNVPSGDYTLLFLLNSPSYSPGSPFFSDYIDWLTIDYNESIDIGVTEVYTGNTVSTWFLRNHEAMGGGAEQDIFSFRWQASGVSQQTWVDRFYLIPVRRVDDGEGGTYTEVNCDAVEEAYNEEEEEEEGGEPPPTTPTGGGGSYPWEGGFGCNTCPQPTFTNALSIGVWISYLGCQISSLFFCALRTWIYNVWSTVQYLTLLLPLGINSILGIIQSLWGWVSWAWGVMLAILAEAFDMGTSLYYFYIFGVNQLAAWAFDWLEEILSWAGLNLEDVLGWVQLLAQAFSPGYWVRFILELEFVQLAWSWVQMAIDTYGIVSTIGLVVSTLFWQFVEALQEFLGLIWMIITEVRGAFSTEAYEVVLNTGSGEINTVDPAALSADGFNATKVFWMMLMSLAAADFFVEVFPVELILVPAVGALCFGVFTWTLNQWQKGLPF